MLSLGEIEDLRKVQFAQWQREFIAADEPELIACCGRKSGKTEAAAAKITLDAMNNNFSHTDGIGIISNGQRCAKELLMVVRANLRALGQEFQKDINKDEPYGSMLMLRLDNMNKVQAFPCGHAGDPIRPFNFYKLFQDEAAYIPALVETAVSACLAVHGVQRIRASTPAGTTGTFYDRYHEPDTSIRRWHVKSKDCPWVSPAFLRREKQKMTKAEYQQEYEALFTELADGIYARAIIAASTGREMEWDKIKARATAFWIGADFAKFGDDENVIAYNYFDGVRSHIRVEIVRTKFRTTQIAARIAFIAEHEPKFKLVITDEGGLGEGPTDILIDRLGRRKVIGVKNQRRGEGGKYMSVHLHRHLIKLMESGEVMLDDDMAIVRSLRSMKFRYTMENQLTIYGRDSHVAEAIVRCVFPLLIGRKPIGDISFGFIPHKSINEEEDIYTL